MTADPTDSIFTFTFQASSGDSWGGWIVEDGDALAPGTALFTPFGRYVITDREDRGFDLSPLGLEEGMVFVDWYYDGRSGQFLPTRGGAATPAGFAGLGSEADAAWNGVAWDGFGAGGADQANLATLPRSLFTWEMVTDAGDVLTGTLLADAVAYDPGDTRRGAAGTYRILTEVGVGVENTDPVGRVWLTRYRDGGSGLDLQLQSGGTAPAGAAGLGSELDRVWDGFAWVSVGAGGALQADVRPAVTYFAFRADGGDSWSGYTLDHAARYRQGEVLETAEGAYEITNIVGWGGTGFTPGAVWITGYSDAAARAGATPLAVQSTTTRGGAPANGLGIGNEVEYAWNGSAWQAFGRGGAQQVDMDVRQSLYDWYFQANSGDLYTGWLADTHWRYQPNDVIATPHGRYVIQAETEFRRDIGIQNGTVWTNGYFDSASNSWLNIRNYYDLNASSGQRGLGSELDSALAGGQWRLFGEGGARQVDDKPPDSFYGFYFQAASGDLYSGFTIDVASRYAAGQAIATPHGRYVIESKQDFGYSTDLAGTVWTTGYFDGLTARWLDTQNFHIYRGSSSQAGLGAELDHAWTGERWALFGQGGALQADGSRAAAAALEWDLLS